MLSRKRSRNFSAASEKLEELERVKKDAEEIMRLRLPFLKFSNGEKQFACKNVRQSEGGKTAFGTPMVRNNHFGMARSSLHVKNKTQSVTTKKC